MTALPPFMLIDLDDTVITYGLAYEDAWQQVCADHAPDGVDPTLLWQAIDAYSEWFWADPERHRTGRLDLRGQRISAAAEALRQHGCERPGLAEAMGQAYSKLREASLMAYPGAIETLEALRRRGVKLGLLTNGGASLQRPKIERFDLARRFDYVQVEGEIGFGKPEHRAYFHALEQLGATPEQTWIVGDNLQWEVVVPQRLGLYAVWHDPTGRGLGGSGVRPDRVIRSLSELLDA